MAKIRSPFSCQASKEVSWRTNSRHRTATAKATDRPTMLISEIVLLRPNTRRAMIRLLFHIV